MKDVRLKLGSRSYNIFVGAGLLAKADRLLRELGFNEKLIMITDPRVRKLYGESLNQTLSNAGFKVTILEVPEGEAQKSLETAGRLFQKLTDAYAERSTPILALGGGVIGDLSGFVAATYLRGVPLIQLPTTLLAQVDSSIGGKVAVNHGQLKNKIGVFYQPRLVIADVDILKSLPGEEVADGLAEIIKSAAIRDAEFFSYLENNIDRVKTLDSETLEEVVSRTARIKAGIVERDELDLGLRSVLNYGHTIGHAIETASDFKIGHGGAVAIGMVAAGRIANKLGILDLNDRARLEALIKRAGLPTQIPDLNTKLLIEAMKHDKKVSGGTMRFVLLRSIGSVFVTKAVDFSLVEQVLIEKNEAA